MSYYGPGTEDLSFVPLTVEEEKNLFIRFYASPADAVTEDSLAARDEIIQRHLKFTAKLSLTYAKRALADDDAISAGNMGLVQALEARRFEPARGIRFASYVRSYIRGQVCSALRSISPSVILPGRDNAASQFPEGAAVTGLGGGEQGEILWDGEVVVDHKYENQQLNEERRRFIDGALRRMSRLERISIRGVELKGQAPIAVAKEAGVSRQAVHQAYFRGMQKLRRAMARRKDLA